jgi:glycosyltransferase involved in cell wall biosynthesis
LKKLLIISYNYPPVGNVGWIRPTKLATYLPAHGWSPTVLTVTKDRTKWGKFDPAEGPVPGVDVVRAPFPDFLTGARGVLVRAGLVDGEYTGAAGDFTSETVRAAAALKTPKAVVDFTRQWLAFPDRYAMWIPFALLYGFRELMRGGYSLIWSTSPPVSCHIVASVLQRLSGLPWVADFRDPWSHKYFELTAGRLRADRLMEKVTLRNTAALTTVSQPMASQLEAEASPRRGGVVSIPNGFDPADYSGEVEAIKDRFVFTHTGSLFGLKRDPSALFQAVGELIEEGKIEARDILFRFFGPPEPGLPGLCERFNCANMVAQEGVVSRTEAIRSQRESTALLVLLWDQPGAARGYVGKVLEYLGAERPILAWAPAGGITGDLLRRTGAGLAVSSVDDLKSALASWFDEFRSTGALAYRGRSEEVQRYNWRALSGRFAELFDDVVERRTQELS